MEPINRLKAWLESNQSLAFDLVRIYLGLGLFAKGVYFASHIGDVMQLLDKGSLNVPNVVLAHFVALAHLTGGLLVAAGLLTRLAAALQVPIVFGAVVLVHWREGVFGSSQNLEFALLVLFLLVLTVVHGGGRFSADAWLSKRQRVLEEASHPPPSLSEAH